MAANKYIALVSNKLKEVFASVTGTANAIPAGDATGRLDISWMPLGVGQEVVVAVTSDNLVAGEFVNLYLNGGVITIRKADATTNAKPAHGFVTAITTAPASATMYILGVNNAYMAGLTIGTKYVLSKTTPGGVTDIASFSGVAGNIVQELGIATDTTSLLTIQNQGYIEVA